VDEIKALTWCQGFVHEVMILLCLLFAFVNGSSNVDFVQLASL